MEDFENTLLKKRVFVETTCMETQTIYYENGRISTQPCDFERGQQICARGRTRVRQSGRMITEDSGDSTFIPYAHGTGSRYTALFETPHTEVKRTKRELIVTSRYPLKYGKEKILEEYGEDCRAVKAFVSARPTITRW